MGMKNKQMTPAELAEKLRAQAEEQPDPTPEQLDAAGIEYKLTQLDNGAYELRIPVAKQHEKLRALGFDTACSSLYYSTETEEQAEARAREREKQARAEQALQARISDMKKHLKGMRQKLDGLAQDWRDNHQLPGDSSYELNSPGVRLLSAYRQLRDAITELERPLVEKSVRELVEKANKLIVG